MKKTSTLQHLTHLEHTATSFGFAWETPEQIMNQIRSECTEIAEHFHCPSQRVQLQEEIGDLLHAAFSLCVFCDFDPEITLQNSVDKFEKRLDAVKTLAQKEGLSSLKGMPFEKLMAFWEAAKKVS